MNTPLIGLKNYDYKNVPNDYCTTQSQILKEIPCKKTKLVGEMSKVYGDETLLHLK